MGHTGADEQRSGTSWDDWLYDTLPNLELEGKKVAIFGCGDQESYSDYYCDAAESFMTSLPRRDARFTVSLQPRDTTMKILKHKEMASSLDLCATRTTNMIYLRTVLKLGLLNLKMRDSSKRL